MNPRSDTSSDGLGASVHYDGLVAQVAMHTCRHPTGDRQAHADCAQCRHATPRGDPATAL